MVVLAGCGGGGGGGGGAGGHPPGGMPTATVVGMTGGAVTSSDGKLALAIPAGAVGGNVTITTEPATPPAAGAVGTVYEIGPSGTQFAMPVTLTLYYAAADVAGMTESSLRVATFAGGSWQILPGAVVDTQNKTVSGVTTHLSPYAIVTEAAGKTCATVQANYPCADPGVGGGGAPMCTPPTCAGATNACGQYPGSAMDSCIDGAKGYTASCCFAPSAPICFGVAAGFGCSDPGTGTGGGGAATCPPAPRCATASDACANYPGATLQGCADTATGYAGGCCFPPEAPVCVGITIERLCSGSTSGGTSGCSSPPPRCAEGPACARFAGATVQSCTDTENGYKATCCFAVGSLPALSAGSPGGTTDPGGADGGVPASDAGAMGGTSGGGTGATTGTGATGGGGMMCEPGAACQPGQRCGFGSPTGACMECTCDGGGHLVCAPCPDKPDGGGAGATTGTGGMTGGGGGATTGTGSTTGGGTMCVNGATCDPGQRCGFGSPTGACMECTCDGSGHLVCVPCPDKPDGGGAGATTGTGGMTGGGGGATTGTGSTTGGGTMCVDGATCDPGQRCGYGSPTGACMECTCDGGGHLVCVPCPDKPDGGGPAPPPARRHDRRRHDVCGWRDLPARPALRIARRRLHGVHLRPQRSLRLHALPHGHGRHHRRRHHHRHRRHGRRRHRPVRGDADARARRRPAVQRERILPRRQQLPRALRRRDRRLHVHRGRRHETRTGHVVRDVRPDRGARRLRLPGREAVTL